MSRAEDLAAKAARLRARAEQAPPPAAGAQFADAVTSPTSPEVSRSVATEHSPARVRTRPVRLTVDVSPSEHAALGQLALDAAAELGLARVHGQEIVRALIRRLLVDPQVRREVLADVAEQRRTS